MKNIEKNKSYILNLLPNLIEEETVGDPVSNDSYSIKGKSVSPSQINICYILEDEKAKAIRLPLQVIKLIKNCRNGFYKNSKGDFLSFSNISFYLQGDGDIVLSNDRRLEDEPKEWYIEDGYVYHNDIEYQEPLNLFDIKSDYKISFSTIDNQGFIQIVDLKLIKGDPIYKEGDDQSKILNYYKGVKPLKEEMSLYKAYLLNQSSDILFGSNAKKDAWDNRLQELNN